MLKPGGRLFQDVRRLAGVALGQFLSELHALGFVITGCSEIVLDHRHPTRQLLALVMPEPVEV